MIDINNALNHFQSQIGVFNHNKNELAKLLLSEYGYPNQIEIYSTHMKHKDAFVLNGKTLAVVEMKITNEYGSMKFTHSVALCNNLAKKYPNFKDSMK